MKALPLLLLPILLMLPHASGSLLIFNVSAPAIVTLSPVEGFWINVTLSNPGAPVQGANITVVIGTMFFCSVSTTSTFFSNQSQMFGCYGTSGASPAILDQSGYQPVRINGGAGPLIDIVPTMPTPRPSLGGGHMLLE